MSALFDGEEIEVDNDTDNEEEDIVLAEFGNHDDAIEEANDGNNDDVSGQDNVQVLAESTQRKRRPITRKQHDDFVYY